MLLFFSVLIAGILITNCLDFVDGIEPPVNGFAFIVGRRGGNYTEKYEKHVGVSGAVLNEEFIDKGGKRKGEYCWVIVAGNCG